MVKVEIVPWDVHEALTETARAGRDLDETARSVRDGGQRIESGFGTATTAHSAFAAFWGARDALGCNAAATVHYQTWQVAQAAAAFVRMDHDMDSKAEQTVAREQAARVTEGFSDS